MSEQGQSLREQLELFLNEQLEQIVISNPRDAEIARKIKVRPVGLRGQLAFQAEEFRGKQAFHRNLPKAEMIAFIDEAMSSYRQLELTSESGRLTVLVSKNGKRTVKMRRLQAAGAEAQSKEQAQPGEQQTQLDRQQVQLGGQQAGPDRQQAQPAGQKIRPAGQQAVSDRQRTQPAGQKMRPAGQQVQPPLQHNRRKRYILEEGRPVPFLKDLGVMTAEGKIVSARYDKFRQINRFLEFIEDILPKLPREREVRIIDFGCGKSYLTFAMYYYLHELCGCDVRITGLDLKQDVIDHCSALAVRL